MKKLMNIFYIVEISPLPLYLSIVLLDVIIGFIASMNLFLYSNLLFWSSLIIMILLTIIWINDLLEESYNKFTNLELNSLYFGYLLFILTEVLIFSTFFIALIYYALTPHYSISKFFPPLGINMVSPWGSPLLNTIILFCSGMTITICINNLISKNKIKSIIFMILTIILSFIFLFIQYYEYSELNFSIEDSVFGTIFYTLTGFHGFHVLIGTIFLIYALFSINNYTNTNYLGLKASSIYWHFVDYVWLLLFFILYVWSL